MAKLDNEAVSVGDLVYDIIYGSATVVETSSGSFKVVFQNSRSMTVIGNGTVSGRRRVYWHNPVVFFPPKTAKKWLRMREIVQTIKELLDKDY